MSGPTPLKPPLPAPIPPQVVPEVVGELIALQKRQFEIREKEIEVQRIAAEAEKRKIEHAQEYALKALEAQADDRKDDRKHEATSVRLGFWILLIGIVGAFGLTGYALYANKDQLILEIVKAIVLAGGGGGVGYVIGFKKGEKSVASAPPTNP